MNNKDLDKKVKRLIEHNIYEKGYVCALDILLQMDYLKQKDYEDWRFGRVPYLEKVCGVNLNKLKLINKSIRKHSSELKLKCSLTAYNQYGKGTKRRLKFSKSGDKKIEENYSTHFVDTNRMIELKEKKQVIKHCDDVQNLRKTTYFQGQ